MKNYSFKINGQNYDVQIDDVNEASTLAHVTVNGTAYEVEIAGAKGSVVSRPQVAPAPKEANSAMITDTIAAGQTLVVLEAMKMENNIDADRAGVVKQISVQQGATVMEGDTLIIIE